MSWPTGLCSGTEILSHDRRQVGAPGSPGTVDLVPSRSPDSRGRTTTPVPATPRVHGRGTPPHHGKHATRPHARSEIARVLDQERRRKGRSALHGIPIAVKDSIDVSAAAPTLRPSVSRAPCGAVVGQKRARPHGNPGMYGNAGNLESVSYRFYGDWQGSNRAARFPLVAIRHESHPLRRPPIFCFQ
jgi:hypothetical protein